jgi:hypothetical protein
MLIPQFNFGGLWRLLAFYDFFFLEFFKLVKIAIVQMLGLVENE